MLSNTAEYALRAIVFLATHLESPCTAQAIAKATKVPSGYLSKVLQDLVKAGLALSQRGPNGGFTLSRDPREIAVLEVVNAVDPIRRIRSCPLGLPSHGKSLCALHQHLDNTIAQVEKTFAAVSVAELMEPSRAGTKCLFPTLNRRAIGDKARAPAG